MKKYGKTIIMISIIAVLMLGFFFYLANRTPTQDATEKAVANEEMAKLIAKDLDANYPESPKEVVKLYAGITKAYYRTTLTMDQITALGTQARKLFDKELLSTQTDADFLTALKRDIDSYNAANRYIADYKIASSDTVKYTTFQDRRYASIIVLYSIREGSELVNSYTRFTLRLDEDGKWKILFWELVNSTSL